MLTFKETLDKANEANIITWRLVAAREVAIYLENEEIFEVSDYEFEQICDFVYDWLINTDAQPYEVINALVRVVQASDKYTFSDIDRYWNEITKEVNDMF